MLSKTLDVVERIVSVIDTANLRLSEAEAQAFLPHFVQRAGELKESMRAKVRHIYRQLCRIYPASKIFGFLLDGLKCKASSARLKR